MTKSAPSSRSSSCSPPKYGTWTGNNDMELTSPCGDAMLPRVKVDIDDAMERLGMGAFQLQILFAAGLCFAADAMEVLLLSFLSVILTVEWGLEKHQNDTLISVVFLGAMSGTLVLSPLGDRIGRRPVFSLTAAIIALFGIGTALCSTYEALLFARFMVGFGVGGLVVPFDTLAEFLPSDFRGPNLLYIEYFWSAGTLLVPACAWISLGHGGEEKENEGSWQLFCILCAVPCIISTLLGMLLVPESPRWLLSRGRNEEALAIVRHAAARNGKDAFLLFPPGTYLVQNEVEQHGTLCDLFSPVWLRTTILLWIAWFGLAFLYYGTILAVSAVFTEIEQDIDGEEDSYSFDYQAIFISASAEIAGVTLVVMTIDRWGRIPTQKVTYLLGGTTCLVLGIAAYHDAPRFILVGLSFLARLAMMGATCTTWVSTSEILTTDIRATGHGYANALGRLGGFFCPYFISENNSLNMIGFYLFAVSCVSTFAVWHLPETAGKKMGEGRQTNALDEDDDDMDGEDYNRF